MKEGWFSPSLYASKLDNNPGYIVKLHINFKVYKFLQTQITIPTIYEKSQIIR